MDTDFIRRLASPFRTAHQRIKRFLEDDYFIHNEFPTEFNEPNLYSDDTHIYPKVQFMRGSMWPNLPKVEGDLYFSSDTNELFTYVNNEMHRIDVYPEVGELATSCTGRLSDYLDQLIYNNLVSMDCTKQEEQEEVEITDEEFEMIICHKEENS